MKYSNRLAYWALAALVLAGCSSAPVKEAKAAKPEWIIKGSGAYTAEAATVFYGVGIANAMPNISLQRKMADQRAREEVAASMKTSMKSMVKDYMDHHVDYFNPNDTAGSDEFGSYVSKSVVDQELVNCRVIDHFEDPDTGALYSLARMDANSDVMDQYKESLKQAIRDNHGNVLRARTDDALKELDKNVDEQRQHENQLLGATEPAPAIPSALSPTAAGK